MAENRVIVAGSRTFRDYLFLEVKLLSILANLKDVEIVSGGQVSKDKETGELYGADYFGEVFARKFDIPIMRFPANWNVYGLSAGPLRNKEMAQYATHAVIFWDGQSKGSKNMIELADKYKLKKRVIMI